MRNELPHDKTNKMACAPSEDSDQPRHLPSLIRVFAVRLKKARILSYPLSAQQRLWSDWAESSLGAHAILLVLSRCGSNVFKLTWSSTALWSVSCSHDPSMTLSSTWHMERNNEVVVLAGLSVSVNSATSSLNRLVYASEGKYIWAWLWENVSYVICEQQRRRWACASTQSDQRLCCFLLR